MSIITSATGTTVAKNIGSLLMIISIALLVAVAIYVVLTLTFSASEPFDGEPVDEDRESGSKTASFIFVAGSIIVFFGGWMLWRDVKVTARPPISEAIKMAKDAVAIIESVAWGQQPGEVIKNDKDTVADINHYTWGQQPGLVACRHDLPGTMEMCEVLIPFNNGGTPSVEAVDKRIKKYSEENNVKPLQYCQYKSSFIVNFVEYMEEPESIGLKFEVCNFSRLLAKQQRLRQYINLMANKDIQPCQFEEAKGYAKVRFLDHKNKTKTLYCLSPKPERYSDAYTLIGPIEKFFFSTCSDHNAKFGTIGYSSGDDLYRWINNWHYLLTSDLERDCSHKEQAFPNVPLYKLYALCPSAMS